MKAAISAFYSAKLNSGIDVVRKIFDASGVEIQDLTNAAKIEYEITLSIMITGESVAGISVIPIDTLSTISVVLPRDFQLSGTPLGGEVRIKCPIFDGTT